MERRGAFDYILLETTGLADPGNIAPIFWVDEGLGSSIYLDGIVTVVDAVNVLRSLDEPAVEEHAEGESKSGHDHEVKGPVMTVVHLQISHADVLLLNKTDLVSTSGLQAVQARCQSINGLAKLLITTHSRVPHLEGVLLDLHAYDGHGTTLPNLFSSKGHSHLDPSISTLSLSFPPFDPQKLVFLEGLLQSLLWDGLGGQSEEGGKKKKPYEIHRLKGFIPVMDGTARIVQGVREIFEIIDADETIKTGPEDEGKIVLIGRGLENIQFGVGM